MSGDRPSDAPPEPETERPMARGPAPCRSDEIAARSRAATPDVAKANSDRLSRRLDALAATAKSLGAIAS